MPPAFAFHLGGMGQARASCRWRLTGEARNSDLARETAAPRELVGGWAFGYIVESFAQRVSSIARLWVNGRGKLPPRAKPDTETGWLCDRPVSLSGYEPCAREWRAVNSKSGGG